MRARALRPHIARLAMAFAIAVGASVQATTPIFKPTGSMHIARAGHQATLLLDGRVLITGGYDNAGKAVAQSEVFSAVMGSWSLAAPNIVSRIDHAAVRLVDGRVLVVGGSPSPTACGSHEAAEIYDPSTDRWSSTGELPIPVGRGMIAVLVRDGSVLAAGGERCGLVSDAAALFSPSANTWSAAGRLTTPRSFQGAVILADSRVLVSGGATTGGRILTSAELYNPATRTWTQTRDLPTSRGVSCGGYMQTFLVKLQNDSVLSAGGLSGDCASATSPAVSASLFDPETSRWSPADSPITRTLTTMTLLPDSQVLVAGGYDASGVVLSSAEFFDPASSRWNVFGALHTARAAHTATRLPNGTILFAGGSDARGQTASAEIYVPEIAYSVRGFPVPRGNSDGSGFHFFGNAWSIATNSKGHIFIAYGSGERKIIEWLPDIRILPVKRYVREMGAGLDEFHSIRIDKADNIWAVSQTANTITKFDPIGRVLLRFGRRPQSADNGLEPIVVPDPAQYLSSPTDLSWDSAGNIFVSDAGHARVVKYDPFGRFIAAVGRQGSGPGEMQTPHSIAVDANGHVYVADGDNARIQVFDNDLTLLAIYDTIGHPWALCITPGPHQYLYSGSNPDHSDGAALRTPEVFKLELDGTIVGKAGRADNADGFFFQPHSLECRGEHDIAAANNRDWVHFITLQP